MDASLVATPHRRRLILGSLAGAGMGCWTGARAARAPAHAVVLGAGIAGLCAAWALEQAGFAVTVLEAQARMGGRNWTLRTGDVVADVLGEPQTCTFSAGQYLNAGPWRILPQHRRVLAWVQRLGIALEPLDVPDGGVQWQPAGGMDALPRAMAQALGAAVRTGCTVHRVTQRVAHGRSGVQIEFTSQGRVQQLEADYALLTLPLDRLGIVAPELPAALQAHLSTTQTADAIKLAFETPTRPRARVTDATASCRVLWSGAADTPPPYIATVYGNGQAIAAQFQVPRPAQLTQAQALLRQAGADPAQAWGCPLVVQWSRVPFAASAAARLPPAAHAALTQLRRGLPPLFFAGDGLSSSIGWQEGAMQSAQSAVRALLQHHTLSA